MRLNTSATMPEEYNRGFFARLFKRIDDAVNNVSDGTYPISFAITGSVSSTTGGWFGSAALATNATTGFLYLPTCAGAPTGVPTAKTGQAAIVFDSTNNRIYIYNGAWKSVAVA